MDSILDYNHCKDSAFDLSANDSNSSYDINDRDNSYRDKLYNWIEILLLHYSFVFVEFTNEIIVASLRVKSR